MRWRILDSPEPLSPARSDPFYSTAEGPSFLSGSLAVSVIPRGRTMKIEVRYKSID